MFPTLNPENDKDWREHDRLTAAIAMSRRSLKEAQSTLQDMIEELANGEYELGVLAGSRTR